MQASESLFIVFILFFSSAFAVRVDESEHLEVHDETPDGIIQNTSMKKSVWVKKNASSNSTSLLHRGAVSRSHEKNESRSLTKEMSMTVIVAVQFGLMLFTLMIGYVIGSNSASGDEAPGTPKKKGPKSIKEEIKDACPALNDIAAFRRARQIMKDRGAKALKEELIRAGSMNADNGFLKADKDSKNIFAKIAAGSMVQERMQSEQECLNQYQSRFCICCNRKQDDLQWNTTGQDLLPKYSMSHRHRFITTRNLHWQWFNPISWGLVPPEDGGVDLAGALQEAMDLTAAIQTYVKHCSEPTWSDQVMPFVHAYGHSGVNSLFVHILDMKELGPSFGFHFNKNLPLPVVVQVLREEYEASKPPGASLPTMLPLLGDGASEHSEGEQHEDDDVPKKALTLDDVNA